MFHYVIQIRNDHTELTRALEEISGQLQKHGMAAEFISIANLGLEEVLTNVIKHGCYEGREHRIDIAVTWRGGELQIEVKDDGREFNPLNQPEPPANQPLDERQPGGWGIPLVKRLFDDVTYDYRKFRNVLLLRKRLNSMK